MEPGDALCGALMMLFIFVILPILIMIGIATNFGQ
jgi:hypothetical protein